jgi:hypothetical protein
VNARSAGKKRQRQRRIARLPMARTLFISPPHGDPRPVPRSAACEQTRGSRPKKRSDLLPREVQEQLFSATATHAPVSIDARRYGFVGGWALDQNQCRESGGRGPLTISANRAETFGERGLSTCEFASTTQESANVWRTKAVCSYDGKRWTANIKLSLNGNRLTWESERSPATYLRCSN